MGEKKIKEYISDYGFDPEIAMAAWEYPSKANPRTVAITRLRLEWSRPGFESKSHYTSRTAYKNAMRGEEKIWKFWNWAGMKKPNRPAGSEPERQESQGTRGVSGDQASQETRGGSGDQASERTRGGTGDQASQGTRGASGDQTSRRTRGGSGNQASQTDTQQRPNRTTEEAEV